MSHPPTPSSTRMTNYRWYICAMLFFATTVNYLDRQVLSLTAPDFIMPAFHWSDADYGNITGVFSFAYAICMLFAGRFVDWLGTKRGYLWAIGVWSAGACLHAVCGLITQRAAGLPDTAALLRATGDTAVLIATVSTWCFLVARCVLALGEAGNFPAAIKVTAEYFPKKDRAFSTSIFNAGASVGALASPLLIPPLAKAFGWEMAFIIIGALGFVWMGAWVFMYDKPEKIRFVNAAELDYIEQDKHEHAAAAAPAAPAAAIAAAAAPAPEAAAGKKIPFLKCFTFRQTWAFIAGKFMTDGVWWFFLFWMPVYLKTFNIKMTEGRGMAMIFTLYAIVTVLSIFGGKLPTVFINNGAANPYAARMKAMLIFAFFPLAVLLAQPLGTISPWLSVLMISLGCAAHQAWSANLFSTIGDMIPKAAIATVTGIGGAAGGFASMLMNKGAGTFFDHAAGAALDAGKLVPMTGELLAKGAQYARAPLHFMGFEGRPAGYFVIFCICAIAYLIGWAIMKTLVPKYKPITRY